MLVHKFIIPSVPSSMNAMYNYVWKGHLEVILKPDVRTWKDKAKLFIKPLKLPEKFKAELSLTFYIPCYYKNGNVKKIDTANLLKVTQDAICEKLGFDDCHVWKNVLEKIDSTEGKVIGELKVYDELATTA